MVGDDDNDRGEHDDAGGGHYNKSSGITPLRILPSPSPVGRTRRRSMPCVSPLAPVGTANPPPPDRRTTCPSSLSPRRLLSACASASHLPLVRFDGWLLRHLLLHRLHLASRAVISRSLDTAVTVVSPSRRPSPSRHPLPSPSSPSPSPSSSPSSLSSPSSPSSPLSPSSLLPLSLRRRHAFCCRCVAVTLPIAVVAVGRRAVWPRQFGPPCCPAGTAVAAKPPPCCPHHCRAATTSAALLPPPPC